MTVLISVDELRATRPGPVVLDVRYRLLGPAARNDYDEGHVPGARFVDLDVDLASPPGPRGRHPLPAPAAFEAAMQRLGVSGGRPVVCYDAGDSTSAARAWWLLRFHGHGDVRVLDGGYAAWRATGGEPSVQVPDVVRGDFVAVPGQVPLLDASAAVAMTRSGVLLDARSAERYRGDAEPIDAVAGHIPGALSAPSTAYVDADGRLLPADALRRVFGDLGVSESSAVGAYCGSGIVATHTILALEAAGLRGSALYADSWSGWITDPTRPVAIGAGGAPG